VSRESNMQDRDERPERVNGLESQGRWSWSGPWPGAWQWRSRRENVWREHHLRSWHAP